MVSGTKASETKTITSTEVRRLKTMTFAVVWECRALWVMESMARNTGGGINKAGGHQTLKDFG